MFLSFKLNEVLKKGMGINPFDLTFGSKSFKMKMKQFLLEFYILILIIIKKLKCVKYFISQCFKLSHI
jgi:hypothetical protein